MNAFKNKGIYWGLLVIVSMFVMVLGLRVARNGTVVNIFYIYAMAIRDVILFMLIIPIISLITIHEIDGFMATSKLLALNNRLAWWEALKRKLLEDCLVSVTVIIFPTFFMTNISIGTIKTFGEWVYMLFLFLTYFMYFFLLALCIVAVEIKFHQSLLAISLVLIISFLPNILGLLFRRLRIPTISRLLNLSYALDEDNFYWLRCGGICIALFTLLILIETAGKVLFKKQDIYWK